MNCQNLDVEKFRSQNILAYANSLLLCSRNFSMYAVYVLADLIVKVVILHMAKLRHVECQEVDACYLARTFLVYNFGICKI